MKDKWTRQHQIVKDAIISGCALEVGRLSICCINDYYGRGTTLKFQVDCEDYRKNFSHLFHSLDNAVDLFVKTKKKLYDRKQR